MGGERVGGRGNISLYLGGKTQRNSTQHQLLSLERVLSDVPAFYDRQVVCQRSS